MARRGWREDAPDGWVQIIRGPRPRSVQWPRASQQSRQVAGQSQPRQQPKPKPTVVKTLGTRPLGDPQVRVAAAEERVTKLESALEGVARCGGSGSRHSSSCFNTGQGGQDGFAFGRADHTVREFLVQSPGTSDLVIANIQETSQRLEALKVQQQQFVAAPPPPLDTESELRQLRETVAQLTGQLVKPAATSEGPVS